MNLEHKINNGKIKITKVCKYTNTNGLSITIDINEHKVKEIKYHSPVGYGDLTYCDILYQDNTGTRLFNPDEIEYIKI